MEKTMPEGKSRQIRVAIIYAHPNKKGKCGKILAKTLSIMEEEKQPHYLIDLYKDNFNPVMSAQELENYGASVLPDVKKYQDEISRSELLIIIYPVWWSTPPAILKGFIDRVFTPNFAFSFEKGKLKGLLKGKKALVVRTFASGAEAEQRIGSVAINFMDKAVLGACGIRVASIDIYSAEGMHKTTFDYHLFQLEGAARRLLVRPKPIPHHLRWVEAPYLPPIERKERHHKKPAVDGKIDEKQASPGISIQYGKTGNKGAKSYASKEAREKQGKYANRGKGQTRGFEGREPWKQGKYLKSGGMPQEHGKTMEDLKTKHQEPEMEDLPIFDKTGKQIREKKKKEHKKHKWKFHHRKR